MPTTGTKSGADVEDVGGADVEGKKVYQLDYAYLIDSIQGLVGGFLLLRN
jgi:hypothetical protein